MATIKPVYSLIPPAPKIGHTLGGAGGAYPASATTDIEALHGTDAALGGPVKATATITMTDVDQMSNNDGPTLTDTVAGGHAFLIGTDPATGGWSKGATENSAATGLAAAINTNAAFTAVAVGAVVTVTQSVAGSVGNTAITYVDINAAGHTHDTNFVGGATHAMTGYDESDEAITALVAGYATDAAEAKKLEHARKVVLGYI